MNKQYYKEEMCRLLEDTNTYKLLKSDPIFEFKEDLGLLVQKGLKRKVLTKKEADYLDPSVCRTPIIYFLPKVHKNTLQPPGRPIVNGIDSVSARLGQYIDFSLKPSVSEDKSFLRDTKQFIQILEGVPCMFDSLHCYGPNCLANTESLQCLEFCLTKNYFWYNKNFYLQTMGVAMG